MDFNEFREKWNSEWALTEEGALRAFLIGVIEYLKNPDEGGRMVALTLPDHYINDDGSPGRDAFLEYFARNDGNAAKSYLGGTPENGYRYDYGHPIRILEQSDLGESESKIFIQSGGKDLPSPVHLRKNADGIWKLFNVSSLATGVRKTANRDF
ncbi:MAG: hypothetical protein JXA64_02895 [Candidatus Fermentibacteraceae bacterium]|nr:hypothetical protein [Candidatus Fermentibacteraceae bacterium]MBN2608037.1 hypothetical protein [Candidatus Fermentibacteraceae bacterium]